jgi:molybdopterin-synthase adenylyltransferase
MVITTGMLMAYETLSILMGRQSNTDYRGWFLNPYKPAIERPLPTPVAALWTPVVHRFLARMMRM